ncbi:beta-galactosidase [Longispora urticae]
MTMRYGGDWNPEQWDPDTWREDVRLMRRAGVNMITLGVFSWARLEPAEGAYELDWLAEIIDLLWSHGISVDLATGTASPPAWFVRKYPDALPVTADGVRLEFGSRQHYCPSSPAFRAATVALATRMAERFADHPALAMWHISNEYGDHVTECFCPTSAADFRRWLGARYGTVERLNHAWGTDFWAQRYTSLDEVEPPRTAPGPTNPTQRLDWRRFCSDTLLDCYRAERAVLPPGVPVTTNFMSMMRDLDYWKWAAEEDIVSDDAYPDPADPTAHVTAAMNYDLMRSLRGGQPWLLLEQAPSAVSWRQVNVPKTDGQYRIGSLQAVARGADGVLHFQWRASVAGAEKWHSAMLPHGGETSRGYRRTVAFGAELARLSPVVGARSTAHVAIVLDWDSWWALELDEHPSQLLRWRELVRAWYEPLWNMNVAVDFVPVDADLTGYGLVLAPNLYLVTDPTRANLESYVSGGGRLVVGFFSGLVDGNDHVHQGGYPGALRDLLGVAVDELWPLPAGESSDISLDGRYPVTLWREWLDTTTAEVEASYLDAPLAGRPAITRNRFGAGTAWYVSAHLGADGLDSLLRPILDEAAVPRVGSDGGPGQVGSAGAPVAVPPGVELCRRGEYLFVLNHTPDPVTVEVTGHDLLTGTPVDGTLHLAGSDVAVLGSVAPESTHPGSAG